MIRLFYFGSLLNVVIISVNLFILKPELDDIAASFKQFKCFATNCKKDINAIGQRASVKTYIHQFVADCNNRYSFIASSNKDNRRIVFCFAEFDSTSLDTNSLGFEYSYNAYLRRRRSYESDINYFSYEYFMPQFWRKSQTVEQLSHIINSRILAQSDTMICCRCYIRNSALIDSLATNLLVQRESSNTYSIIKNKPCYCCPASRNI